MTNHPNRTKAAEQRDHAKENARAWVETMACLVAGLNCDYDRLQELRDERADLVSEAEDYTNVEQDTSRGHLMAWDKDHAEELRELTESATVDGELFDDADKVRERIEESPLSIQVRSGWVTPGEQMEAEEFEILLSTGGPALRIRGELDEHRQPDRAWLEYQDWGTGWTQYFDVEQSTLLAFASVFYFGE